MRSKHLPLFLLRISLGWLFFYAGISKLMASGWSASGYLMGAKTMPGLYHWFASPGVIPVINFINEYGLLLLGISLILGIFVRLSSVLGAVLMVLYYIPILEFPYIGKTAMLVDEHIVYALALFVLRDARWLSLDAWMAEQPFVRQSLVLKWLVGADKDTR